MLRILLISAGAILETLFIMRSYRRRDGMSVFLKTAASLVFVLLGLLELRRTGTSVYGELVVAGLTADQYGLNGLVLGGPLWIGALIAALSVFLGLILHALRRRKAS